MSTTNSTKWEELPAKRAKQQEEDRAAITDPTSTSDQLRNTDEFSIAILYVEDDDDQQVFGEYNRESSLLVQSAQTYNTILAILFTLFFILVLACRITYAYGMDITQFFASATAISVHMLAVFTLIAASVYATFCLPGNTAGSHMWVINGLMTIISAIRLYALHDINTTTTKRESAAALSSVFKVINLPITQATVLAVGYVLWLISLRFKMSRVITFLISLGLFASPFVPGYGAMICSSMVVSVMVTGVLVIHCVASYGLNLLDSILLLLFGAILVGRGLIKSLVIELPNQVHGSGQRLSQMITWDIMAATYVVILHSLHRFVPKQRSGRAMVSMTIAVGILVCCSMIPDAAIVIVARLDNVMRALIFSSIISFIYRQSLNQRTGNPFPIVYCVLVLVLDKMIEGMVYN